MKVFYELEHLPNFKNSVITIGSFDGVHHGHQKIIEKVNQLARQINGESIIITFHPHPRLVVYPKDDSLQLITSIDEKIRLIEQFGADNVVVVPFTVEFSQQSADEYIQKFLVEKFNPRYIVIGYDHRFGLGRQGDVNYLKWHGEKNGYEVLEIAKQEVEDIAVSSTKIRQSLEKGDIRSANRLLNHPFCLTGKVVKGQRIGSSIGYPTANIEAADNHKLIPPHGIYAVFVLHEEERYQGMLYIGNRPTLKNFNNETIEVNIFDFDKDIYGDQVTLQLVEKIRDDASFKSMEALSEQLANDKQQSLAILSEQVQLEAEKKNHTWPEVAVVILNYNGRAYLEKFLPSVLAGSYPNFKVYVADNGSSDDSLAFLRQNYSEIQIIDLKENYGFAEGYNRALQSVTSQYYALLNSDVEVNPDWIDPIIELMERDATIAAVQPKVRSYKEKDHFEYAGAAGGWIDSLGYPFCRGRIFSITEKDQGQYDDTQEIFWATGAAFFIQSQLFHAIGGFDGDYFAHAEEIDLCWRLKRAGYKIMVRPRSVVYHVGGGTLSYQTPRKTYLNFRNTLITIAKNIESEKLWKVVTARLLLDFLAGGLFLFQGKWRHIGSIIKAHWNFFGRMKQTFQKRRLYKELIDKVSIQTTPNKEGRYSGSIVWQFYAKGRHFFKQL
jgi:riboflavin kinase/FMN adenylyltransferase